MVLEALRAGFFEAQLLHRAGGMKVNWIAVWGLPLLLCTHTWGLQPGVANRGVSGCGGMQKSSKIGN